LVEPIQSQLEARAFCELTRRRGTLGSRADGRGKGYGLADWG
jgi:hypothetical protein